MTRSLGRVGRLFDLRELMLLSVFYARFPQDLSLRKRCVVGGRNPPDTISRVFRSATVTTRPPCVVPIIRYSALLVLRFLTSTWPLTTT